MSDAERHARAWLFQVAAVAVHVVEEAIYEVLGFFSPVVPEFRERFGFWPIPTVTFGVWLGGLAALCVGLTLFAPLVKRGVRGTRTLCWLFAVSMIGTGIVHLAMAAYFQQWLPGTTTTPVLLIAAVALINATRARTRHANTP